MLTPQQKLGNCLIDIRMATSEVRRLAILIDKQEQSTYRNPNKIKRLKTQLVKAKERLEGCKETYNQLKESLANV